MINKYNDITPKTLDEKKKYYAEHNIFKTNLWNKKVKCNHCGKVFNFNDFKVICEKPDYSEEEHEYIVCKHYPECDGTLIDMVEINNEEENND